MMKISRKVTLMLSLIFISISTAFLAPIQYFDMDVVLVLSFTSRVFAGIGSTCAMIAADSICISDYPDCMEKMIGRIEAAIGLGIIIGPLLGAIMNLGELFYSLLAYALFVLVCTPFIWKLLGTFRDYKAENIRINTIGLLFRPVMLYLENSFRLRYEYCLIVFSWLYNSDSRIAFAII